MYKSRRIEKKKELDLNLNLLSHIQYNINLLMVISRVLQIIDTI